MKSAFQIAKIVLVAVMSCLLVLLLGNSAAWSTASTLCDGHEHDIYLEVYSTTAEDDWLVFQGECVRDSKGNLVDVRQSHAINVDYQVKRTVKTVFDRKFGWKRYSRQWVTATSVSWSNNSYTFTEPSVEYDRGIERLKVSKGPNGLTAYTKGLKPAAFRVLVYADKGNIGTAPVRPVVGPEPPQRK